VGVVIVLMLVIAAFFFNHLKSRRLDEEPRFYTILFHLQGGRVVECTFDEQGAFHSLELHLENRRLLLDNHQLLAGPVPKPVRKKVAKPVATSMPDADVVPPNGSMSSKTRARQPKKENVDLNFRATQPSRSKK